MRTYIYMYIYNIQYIYIYTSIHICGVSCCVHRRILADRPNGSTEAFNEPCICGLVRSIWCDVVSSSISWGIPSDNGSLEIPMFNLPSGERLHSNGKIHHFSWENDHEISTGPFSIANCDSSPEGMNLWIDDHPQEQMGMSENGVQTPNEIAI